MGVGYLMFLDTWGVKMYCCGFEPCLTTICIQNRCTELCECKYVSLSYPGDSISHVLWHTGWVLLSGSQRYREQKGWTCAFSGVTNLGRDFRSVSQESCSNTTQPQWPRQTPPSSSSQPPISCTCCLTGIPLHPYCNPNQLKCLRLHITERSRKRGWDSWDSTKKLHFSAKRKVTLQHHQDKKKTYIKR